MKTERSEVKSQQKLVGTAEYPVFDTIQEARDTFGDEACLELINAQTKTNEMNRIRSDATTKPSKKRLMRLALGELTPQEIGPIAGDSAAIEALIQKKMNEIESRLAAAGPDEDGSSDDGNDEN